VAISHYHESKTKNKFAREHYRQLCDYIGHVERFDPKDLINVVMVPIYKEPLEVVQSAIESILNSDYPMKQVILIIAYEERAGQSTEETAQALVAKYGDKFMFAEAIKHPKNIPNELAGKGSNITFAGRYLQRYLTKQQIEPGRVIVTTLDSDNRVHKGYLACLSYTYIITPNRRYKSYQPVAMYINNIWDVPAPMRVLATGNSFWTILQSVRPHLLRNFSSHAQSMDSLIDTDFWSVRTIVEDGHQFWRSYFRYDGAYEVVAIHLPVYQDAVLSTTYWSTLKAQFIQFRRWAYGVSDIPYLAVRGFTRKRTVPFWDFLFKFLRLLEGHVSQATVSLILLFASQVPLYVGHHTSKSIVAHQLPIIASYAETIALFGIFISIFFSMKMLPKRPERYKRRRTFVMLIQWVLLPVVSIIYGSVASLYSQTRLMIGKYLERFDVTEKVVRASRISK
jgi:cellulose synthase/poly-beta-1,6-N-acetylglucosamine synthase-like glycosyltransferase